MIFNIYLDRYTILYSYSISVPSRRTDSFLISHDNHLWRLCNNFINNNIYTESNVSYTLTSSCLLIIVGFKTSQYAHYCQQLHQCCTMYHDELRDTLGSDYRFEVVLEVWVKCGVFWYTSDQGHTEHTLKCSRQVWDLGQKHCLTAAVDIVSIQLKLIAFRSGIRYHLKCQLTICDHISLPPQIVEWISENTAKQRKTLHLCSAIQLDKGILVICVPNLIFKQKEAFLI